MQNKQNKPFFQQRNCKSEAKFSNCKALSGCLLVSDLWYKFSSKKRTIEEETMVGTFGTVDEVETCSIATDIFI